MSMESGGWRYSGPRAQRARPEAVAYHDGDRHDFVRRYHKVIAKAVQRRRQGVRELAPYVLKWATDPRNFRAAWEHCRGGGGSPGPNGRRYEDYEEHDIWALAKVMQAAVLAGTYRPGPERRVRIHKSGKRGYRWLTLQDIEDRVMARAFQQVLGPLLDPFFDNYVFGSRPGRSREQALATAEYLTLQQGRHVWLVRPPGTWPQAVRPYGWDTPFGLAKASWRRASRRRPGRNWKSIWPGHTPNQTRR
jgi:hypothetical protein